MADLPTCMQPMRFVLQFDRGDMPEPVRWAFGDDDLLKLFRNVSR